MKILFIDKKSIQNSIRMGLLEQMAHHDVHFFDDIDKAIAFYTNEKPDMVLIDFVLDFGLAALRKILAINPTQPIITISNSYECADIFGCVFCIENYKKKRVIKHQGIHDLLYLIDNFDEMPCEYAHKYDQCNLHDKPDTSKTEE